MHQRLPGEHCTQRAGLVYHTVYSISDCNMAILSDSLASLGAPTRVVNASPLSPNEESIERALRPKRLSDYVGQHRVREQLEIFIQAARGRSEALDHVLLFGPPGLGKPRWPTLWPTKWG